MMNITNYYQRYCESPLFDFHACGVNSIHVRYCGSRKRLCLRKKFFHVIHSVLLAFLLAGCIAHTAPDVTAETTEPANYAVYPPFAKDKRFIISQGFNSLKTHTGEFNAYAVDFAMPANEPVCAAKAGTIESYNDADRPMPEDNNYREENFVRVIHHDGTWGLYAHLQPGSITVNPGQQIKLGDCFARVGNTGYSTGPHLHFALLKLLPDRFVSVPFLFVQPDGQVLKPKYLGWITN